MAAGLGTGVIAVLAETNGFESSLAASFKKMAAKLPTFLAIGAGVAGLDFLGHAIKDAGNLQFQLTRLNTAAGESLDNLKMVGDGIKQIMTSTGTSLDDATKAMYLIESSGLHGADALKVLANTAKAAKIENADLADVANAVTAAMKDYHVGAEGSADITNTFIAAVAHGKTTLGELANAFTTAGPAAASAKVPIADLASAIAEMTAHGTTAAKAGTYLRQVIGALEGQTTQAKKTMAGLGISANDLSAALTSGPGGLAKAIGMIDDALTKSATGRAGFVAVQGVMKAAAGSADEFDQALGKLPPTTMSQFAALSKMVGGVRSLQGFLLLSGQNLTDFKGVSDDVTKSVKDNSGQIEGWTATSKTFNNQVDRMKAGFQVMAIDVGEKVLPAVSKLMDKILNSGPALKKFWEDYLQKPVESVWKSLKSIDWAAIFDVIKAGFKGIVDLAGPIAVLAIHTLPTLVGAVNGLFHGLKDLAPLVSGFVAMFIGWKGVTLIVGGLVDVFWALDTAMKANPALMVLALAAAFDQLWQHSEAFRAVVAFLVAATGIVLLIDLVTGATLATRLFATAFWALDAAMDANPVGAVIAAAALLAVVFYELWQKSETFRKAMADLANLLTGAVVDAIQFLASEFIDGIKLMLYAVRGLIDGAGWLLSKIGIDLPKGIHNGLTSALNDLDGLQSRIDSMHGTHIVIAVSVVETLGQTAADALAQLPSAASANAHKGIPVNGMDPALTGFADAKAAADAQAAIDKAMADLSKKAGGSTGGSSGGAGNAKAAADAIKKALVAAYGEIKLISKNTGKLTADSIKQDFDTLLGDLKDGKASKKIIDMATATEKSLQTLAAKRDDVMAQLNGSDKYGQGALKNLDDLKKSFEALQVSVTNSFTSIVDVSKYGSAGIHQLTADLQQTLSVGAQFSANMKKLQAEGLNQDAITQLLTAGPAGGAAAAQQYVNAGQAAITGPGGINDLMGQIKAQGLDLGTSLASSFYQHGIDMAQGIVSGLQTQESALEKQMNTLGDKLAAAFKKALGIKSPSTVFAALGAQIPAGIAQGIVSNMGIAHSALAAGASGMGFNASGSVGAQGSSPEIHVYVAGEAVDNVMVKTINKVNRVNKARAVSGSKVGNVAGIR